MKVRVKGRRCIPLLYPALTVIVTCGVKNKINGMAAAWVTPLSHSPTLVGVSISPERLTHSMIVESGEFAINILDFRYLEKVSHMGEVSGRDVENKFELVGLTPIAARRIVSPVVEEASAVLECRLYKRVEVGDHSLFVGEVLEAYAEEDFELDWRLEKYRPIHYLGLQSTPIHLRKYVTSKREVHTVGKLKLPR